MKARGYEQRDGEHYDSDNVSAAVVNALTTHVVMALKVIIRWYAILVDVKGAFLMAELELGRQIYMDVPKVLKPITQEILCYV